MQILESIEKPIKKKVSKPASKKPLNRILPNKTTGITKAVNIIKNKEIPSYASPTQSLFQYHQGKNFPDPKKISFDLANG